MVDWKKDIKLSDLLARDKGEESVDEAKALHPEQPEPDAAPEQDVHQAEAAHEEPVADEADAAEEATPFWKREFTFGREKECADESEVDFDVPAEETEKRPFFKRELSFRRSQEEPAAEADVDAPEAETTGTPFWKREVTFGRRKDDTVRDPDFDTPEEPAQPFWKRELSFGRRKDDEWPPDTPEAGADPATDDAVEADGHETKPPFWKRELSFGRSGDDDSAQEKPVDAAEPAEVQPEPIAPDASEGDTPEETPFWKRELSFGFGHTREQPTAEPEFDEAQSTSERTPFWKRELSFGPTRDESGSEPEFETPEAESQGSPFWKRELNFGRRRDDAAPETPLDVTEPALEQPERVATAVSEADVPESTPFWKRRFSFGRTSDPDFDAPETEKRSFFKRQLSFRRSPESDVEAPRAKKKAKRSLPKLDFSFRRGKDPEFDTPARTQESKPFFKRELTFRRGRGQHAGAVHTSSGARKKQLVGLKVGASQIAAARIVNNGSPELVQLARQPIEQGIVVGGELRDPDALADALRDFFAKHKLPNRNVRLGIGNNRIGVRSFEISGVHDPKQLENAIRFRAQEALPIPLDEAVLDYHVIDETVSPTGIRTYKVLLVVAYRELIDRYVAACRGAGLRLAGIDLEAFALLRALSPPASEGFPEDTALVAVSIGYDRSTFAVSNGTVCEFTRVLDWGGASLNTAIARALDLTPSQAEPVKRALTLSTGEESGTAEVDPRTAQAEEAVRLELQTFARELVSSLHFYQNQPGSLAIGTIVMTGGTAHMPGFAAELQRLIGVKVRVGDPLRRVKPAKRVEAPEQVGSLAVAIGLGIED